ncbi:MAG: hypothetical protein ACREO8_03170 [Luteimonas sp.]
MRTSKLLLGTMLGLCFVSSANAASFSPINTEFALTGGISLTGASGGSTLLCSMNLVGTTDSAGTATITAGSIAGADLCTSYRVTSFPWTISAADAGNIRLDEFFIIPPFPLAPLLFDNKIVAYDSGTFTIPSFRVDFDSPAFPGLDFDAIYSLTLDTTPVLTIVP